MELWQVRYFLAVVDAASFRRAADRLNLSQPPLSRAVAALEADLGVRLLDRGTRRVALTPAGKLFEREARALLEHAERARQVARDASIARSRLTIGFEGSSVYRIVPEMIARFRAGHADVEITLRQMSTPRQVAALKSGELDLGFVVPPLQAADLAILPIWREALSLVLPASHPLADRRSIDLATLAGEPLITSARDDECGLFAAIMALCRVAGFTPNIVLDVNDTALIVGFVAAGIGLALLPASVVRQIGAEVITIPLATPAWATLALASHRANPQNSRDRTAIDAFLALASSPRAARAAAP